MAQNIKLIVYSVSDLEAAQKLFGKYLGIEPYVSGPYYVGFRVGELEVGLTPNTAKQNTAVPIAYLDVADINASLQELVDAGAEVLQNPHDVGGGLWVATLKDGDGNVLGLRQAAGA